MRKLNTSKVFKGNLNKYAKSTIINTLLAGLAFGFGTMKIWDASTNYTCMKHYEALGDIELPEETIEEYEKRNSK